MNAIAVQNLGKKFKLFTSPGGRFLEYMSMGKVKRHEDFWALKDISFDIPTGTTLGILGQNGSGKSTLLSILAGVLYPSEGSFKINGKVSAILELGSGFHQEFSGRDNVYMYGSIMGLSKPEIDDRFDEIVRFSELGDFIDQPLRTYSSGMIVRLAFSVAVNVDADILIVDEALAVGDAIFQHRCFRKIREMQADGKTILYVGHDTEAVRNLCTSALLLDGGRVIERGDPNTVVNKYYALIADRERAYKEGNLIEHGEVPGERYETGYDFVRNLNDAKIESAKGTPVQPQTVEILSTPRRVIFAHPPSRVTYTVPIGPGSSLAFAIGILPAAWDKIPQGVKFDIEVVSDNETDLIFSRVLQPKRNIGDRGWHNFILPLEKFSGKNVTIAFVTTGSGDDLSYGWSAWGWGKIIQIAKKFSTDNVLFQEGFASGNNKILADSSDMLTSIHYGNKKAEIRNVELIDKDGTSKLSFQSGEKILIRYKMFAHHDFTDCLTIGFIIRNKFTEVYGTHTRWQNCDLCEVKKGDMPLVNINIPLSLGAGTYSLTSAIAIIHPSSEVEVLDRLEDHLIFHVKNDKNMIGIIDLNAKISIE
jgi:ABC-type polysaccharide/polyol phosphate transport system ATPase subunit